jgi:hypothetical protein
MRLRTLLLTLAIACSKPVAPVAPAEAPATLVDNARARPVPDLLATRVSLKIRSRPLDIAGSTGGGLVVSRPGKGRFELFGPLGGSLLVVDMDGASLGTYLPGAGRYLVAAEADAVIREVSGGAAGLDDLVAVLVGDLPFDSAAVASIDALDDGAVTAVLMGPDGTTVTAVIDPMGTPRFLMATDSDGKVLLSARYGEFAEVGGALLPEDLHLELPALELVADVRYKSWSAPEVSPVDFSVEPPPGASVESLEEAVKAAVDAQLGGAAP